MTAKASKNNKTLLSSANSPKNKAIIDCWYCNSCKYKNNGLFQNCLQCKKERKDNEFVLPECNPKKFNIIPAADLASIKKRNSYSQTPLTVSLT